MSVLLKWAVIYDCVVVYWQNVIYNKFMLNMGNFIADGLIGELPIQNLTNNCLAGFEWSLPLWIRKFNSKRLGFDKFGEIFC